MHCRPEKSVSEYLLHLCLKVSSTFYIILPSLYVCDALFLRPSILSKLRGLRGLGVLEEGVHAQHRVVRLDASRRDLRARPHRERDLRLLAVVDGETLEEQAAETGPSAAAASVEDHET